MKQFDFKAKQQHKIRNYIACMIKNSNSNQLLRFNLRVGIVLVVAIKLAKQEV